jgi:hypothetical protein
MAYIELFADITRKVIATSGFDDFLPTALYPERKALVALDGVPHDADIETVSLAWAQKNAIGDEEFLVAFKVGHAAFKILRRSPQGIEEGIFSLERTA